MSNGAMPPLPAGYQLDQNAGPPPLPPGYRLDAPSSASAPGFFTRLGQSWGVPTNAAELQEAVKQAALGLIPGYTPAKATMDFLNRRRADIQAIGQGAKEMQQAGGAASLAEPVTEAAIRAIPVVGETAATMGRDIAAGNYAGAAGGATGALTQAALPTAIEGAEALSGVIKAKLAGDPFDQLVLSQRIPKSQAESLRTAAVDAEPDLRMAERQAQATDPRVKIDSAVSYLAAIRQALDSRWAQYQSLVGTAGNIDGATVASKIRQIATPELEVANPRSYAAVNRMADGIESRGSMSPSQAELQLEALNKEADPEEGNAAEYAARSLRSSLNDSIQSNTGAYVSDLKRRIGSLMQLKDAAQRTVAGMPKQESSGLLSSYVSPYIAGRTLIDAARLVAGDPTAAIGLARGGAEIAAMRWAQGERTPDARIEHAFDTLRSQPWKQPETFNVNPNVSSIPNAQAPGVTAQAATPAGGAQARGGAAVPQPLPGNQLVPSAQPAGQTGATAESAAGEYGDIDRLLGKAVSVRAQMDADKVSAPAWQDIQGIVNRYSRDASLQKVMQGAGAQMVDRLIQDGIIQQAERKGLVSGSGLTEMGRQRLVGMMNAYMESRGF